jgi:N-dimethylarginine dimethylaminohydrolase
MSDDATRSAGREPAALPAGGEQPRILMCPPDHYGIEYEINPWMDRQQQADHALAAEQWRALRDMLAEAGAQIRLMPPVAGLPDLVFTANAALIYRQAAVLAQFRHPQRRGEEAHDAEWLTAAGFEVHRLPQGVYFEGAGDALFCGDTLFAGYRIRSDVRGHQQIGALFGCRVIAMELVDPYYYHLDTCFCPLAPNQAIYLRDAFDEYGRRAARDAAGRVRQSRWQRQVPDATARRRGSSRLEARRRISLKPPGRRPSPEAPRQSTVSTCASSSCRCRLRRTAGDSGWGKDRTWVRKDTTPG